MRFVKAAVSATLTKALADLAQARAELKEAARHTSDPR